MTGPLLRTHELTRSFGAFRAVSGVSLEIAEGSIHSVIGPNGAGKTTLFRLLTGVLRPTSGTIEFAGAVIAGRPAHAIARRGLAQTFQTTSVFPRLTVLESVTAAMLASRRRADDLITRFQRRLAAEAVALCAEVGLAHALTAQARTLSHGDQRALEVALALATRPRMLLLDEPTAGMSPYESQRMVTLIRGLASERGLTVLFSEHDMDAVFGISDRVTVLHQGRVIADGLSAAVRANREVMAIYLGSSA